MIVRVVAMTRREFSTLECSRHHHYKRDADRDARWWRRRGGKMVVVRREFDGWVALGTVPVESFSKFCCIEARRRT